MKSEIVMMKCFGMKYRIFVAITLISLAAQV